MNYFFFLRRTYRYFRQKRGLSKTAIWIRKWYTRHPTEVIITDFDSNLTFKCFLHLHIGSRIFWDGCYSCAQLLLLDRVLKFNMVYVDVGANVGEQTVFAAKRLTRGQVIAFEPTTAMYQCLVENVHLNGFHNVRTVKLGLGDQSAKLPIFTSDELSSDGTINEGVPTLYASQKRSRLLETVDIVRFDDYTLQCHLERLDVMKIDVEGAEMAVLRGSERTIRHFAPLIIMEIHEGTSQAAGYSAKVLLEYVESYGYRVEGLLQDGNTRPFDSSELNGFRDVVCYPSLRSC